MAIEKAQKLKELHEGSEAFIIANAWDQGSAKLLEKAGFPAIATTSNGVDYGLGRAMNGSGKDILLQNAADIVEAVTVPVSADLENGFGLTVEAAVDTIQEAIDRGLAGGSIEDVTCVDDPYVIDIELATDRIKAAVEVIKNSGTPFQLVARADNYLIGREELAVSIKRLQAYQEAGADVLYAPGLKTEEEIRAVVSSVDKPVNVVMGLVGSSFSVEQLQEFGVKRISVGSSLQRYSFGMLEKAAQEMLSSGTFSYAEDALSTSYLDKFFE